MKIKDLKYYQQLTKLKNFSAVAQSFNVRQPTITMAIQRLEQEFNTTFFIRDHVHKQLRLTATGEQFARHVDVILNELQIARREIDHANSAKIRFGLPPIIGNYFFPALTPSLMRNHLLTALDTYEYGSRELLRMLQNGELDMALLGSTNPLNLPHLRFQEFARYPFRIIVGRNNPLAGQDAVNFTALKEQQFIIPDAKFFHEQAFKQMCHNAHIRPKILYRTADIHVIKAMVAENLGISFLTSLAVTPADQVVSLKIADPTQAFFRLSVAIRETMVLDPVKQKLWELLLQQTK